MRARWSLGSGGGSCKGTEPRTTEYLMQSRKGAEQYLAQSRKDAEIQNSCKAKLLVEAIIWQPL